MRLTTFFRVGASETPMRAVVDGARDSVNGDLQGSLMGPGEEASRLCSVQIAYLC